MNRAKIAIALMLIIPSLAITCCIQIDKVCGARTAREPEKIEVVRVVYASGTDYSVPAVTKSVESVAESTNSVAENTESVVESANNVPAGQIMSIKDREYIIRVVMAEARGEGFDGMCAVAQVIKNRAELWDKPYIDIVTAENQFAKPYQGEITPEAELAVYCVFDENEKVVSDLTTHFHSVNVHPYWANVYKFDRRIGNHLFYEG